MARGLTMRRCPPGMACVHWVQRYLGDCVCGVRDEVSLALGLISVFSWAVAELPQIFTNFVSRSAEGVSLWFLVAWLVGDAFNLIGCLLEPATLPTQLYSAAWYSIVTVILFLQTIYYGYIYKWWKLRKESDTIYDRKLDPMVMDLKSRRNSIEMSKSSAVEGTLPISRLLMPTTSSSCHTDLDYISDPSYTSKQASVKDREGLVSNYLNTTSPGNTNSILLRTVVGVIIFTSGINLHFHMHNTTTSSSYAKLMQKGFIIHSRRKLLEETNGVTFKGWLKQHKSMLGTCLGWLMTVIYMGGRLPQIYLNGLNPIMFMFAVIGNATYVGSIIVRTMEWERIKPNMPWLVYSTVCVLLDCFILAQFIYYRPKTNQSIM